MKITDVKLIYAKHYLFVHIWKTLPSPPFNNPINQPKLHRLPGRQIMIPLRSHPDLLHGPPRILRQDPIQPVSAVLYMVRHDLDIRRLPRNAVSVNGRLMYHNLRVGESHALPLCPSPKEKRPKACGHAQADSGDITPDILHGIVNSQPLRIWNRQGC